MNSPRLVHATWTLQGYFISSFKDETILVIHPNGKRYWIKQWKNKAPSNEWFGNISYLPRHWKPYIQKAITLRNNCTQCPVWYNGQSSKYEAIQLQEIGEKIEWPGYRQALNDYLLLNLSTTATVLLSVDKAAAMILYRHKQLIQVCISPGNLKYPKLSVNLETWIHSFVQRVGFDAEEEQDENVILLTFPTSHCPSIFHEPLSILQTDIDYHLEEKTVEQLFHQHIIEQIPLDQVIQYTAEYDTFYHLEQRIVALVQYNIDTFYWYSVSQDSITAWKITGLDILRITTGGRIVEYFPLERQHIVHSIHGMPLPFQYSWTTIIDASTRWRNQVKKSLIPFQQQYSAISSCKRKIKNIRQQWCSVDSCGDFKLDNNGYLSCRFLDGTFILYHPNNQYAVIVTSQGSEYRISWRRTVLFRDYLEKIHRIYNYLLLSPFQRREIEKNRKMQQQWIAIQLRNIAVNRAILLLSPPRMVIS